MKYKTVKLGTLISPAKNVRCGDKDYPVLSMTMHNGLVFQDEKFKKVIASKDTSNYKVVFRNQLVISFPIDEGVLAAQRIIDAGIVSPAYGIWNIDQKQVIPEFLENALRCKRAIDYYKAKLRGSTARRRSLPVPTLLDFNVPLPTIEEQNSILEIIHKTKQVIDNRQNVISKLDDLIKARFVEMFGDPIRNTQNRKTTEFVNVVKMQRGFDLPVQDRQQNGAIPVYGSNGALDHHNIAKVQGGGVITGRSGTIGKVFYTEGDYWPLNTSLFSVDTHGNNVVYLAYLLEMFDLTRFVEGTGVPTLNRNMFHNKPIIDVGLNEQIRFAEFVKQVDKSKLLHFDNVA